MLRMCGHLYACLAVSVCNFHEVKLHYFSRYIRFTSGDSVIKFEDDFTQI